MGNQEARGKVKNLEGRVKEAAGIVIGDKELERKGAQERAEGAIEEGIGKTRRKVGEFVEEVGEKIKD